MRNLVATLPTLTSDDDGICASQASAGGALSLNGALVTGGIAYAAAPQIVTITSAGNDSGITFVVAGLDADGTSISETVTGANAGAAVTTYYFETVTSVTASAAVATTVKVGWIGTSTGAITKSLRVNGQQMDFKLGIFVDITGTQTYTAQYAYQQPEDEYSVSYASSADWRSIDGLTALTADGTSNLFYKVNSVRLKITAYTSGTSTLTVTQSY